MLKAKKMRIRSNRGATLGLSHHTGRYTPALGESIGRPQHDPL